MRNITLLSIKGVTRRYNLKLLCIFHTVSLALKDHGMFVIMIVAASPQLPATGWLSPVALQSTLRAICHCSPPQ